MTEAETALLSIALAALRAVEPEIAQAVSGLVNSIVTKSPATPAIKHLQAIADAKALGLNQGKV